MDSAADQEEVARALAVLGCPPEKTGEMASQLIKRAHQLAAARGRTFDEALAHLIRLMAGGWAAQGPASGVASLIGADAGAKPSSKIEAWDVLGRQTLGDYRIFSLHSTTKRHPRTQAEHDFFLIECPSWVNVCAVTPDRRLVMVEQFRHGTSTVELEIPGGIMDPEETDPIATGLRELQEETGYTGQNARLIGCIYPNPAIQSNSCYTVFMENCVRTHEMELDAGEDIAVSLVPLDEIPRLVREGAIRHALVVVGLYYLELMERGKR